MRALEAASALLLGIAATGTIVWYVLWRGRQRLARFRGRPGASAPPTGLFVIFTIAVMLAAAPLVVIALAWGVVARRRLRRHS